MNELALKISEVSKAYRLGQIGSGTLARDLSSWWSKLRGKEDTYSTISENNRDIVGGEFVWALKDINFEVKRGEIIGIIGRNGAGKSTLLKLLSKITSPTSGEILINGKVASLLEVGTGFHPELTGRENIYLNGAILGMSKTEINSRFDQIVAFSGCAKYIETPVKRYSSGMRVRLAFAVAAHLEPDILIVDEVLAVGDAEFQEKCLGKMQEVSRISGRTVLFVSHNLAAVRKLCPRSILMENGKITEIGPTPEIIDFYMQKDSDSSRSLIWESGKAPNSDEIELQKIEVVDSDMTTHTALSTADEILVVIDYCIKKQVRNLRVCFTLLNSEGIEVFCSSDFDYQPKSKYREKGVYRSVCTIPGSLLTTDHYVAKLDFELVWEKALLNDIRIPFAVTELAKNQLGYTVRGKPPGVMHPLLSWDVKKSHDS
jgi:lipopolysaccharide transport system ATP-binding protein